MTDKYRVAIVVVALAVGGAAWYFLGLRPHLACSAAKGQPVMTMTGVACAQPYKGKW